VLELLKWAAGNSPFGRAERIASILEQGHEREFRWVMNAGFGPILHYALQGHLDRVSAAWPDVLLSADLTAQVLDMVAR